jgi:hypothetical protein
MMHQQKFEQKSMINNYGANQKFDSNFGANTPNFNDRIESRLPKMNNMRS